MKEKGEEFFFEPTGGIVTTKDGKVNLQVCFSAKPKVIVEQLYLEIDSIKHISTDWAPIVVSNQYTDYWIFDIAGKVNQNETYRGKLIAKVDKKEYESREFDVPT